MKRSLLPAMMALLAVALPLEANNQSSTQSLLNEAQRAYASGDHETARIKFELVLAQDSRNVAARNYLRMIKAAEAKNGGGKQLERQLSRLTLPTVNLRDATLEAALEFLRQEAEKVGKIKTSFVLGQGVPANKPITLNLSSVPFTEVLRYVGQLAGVQFHYDAYAISVLPASTGAAQVTQGEASASPAPQ